MKEAKRVVGGATRPNWKIVDALAEIVRRIPESDESASTAATARAMALARSASMRAAAISGTLALPPGPWGMVTIVPELIKIWQIQRQLVADIAAVFDKTATLSPEEMLYCLFRHGAGHLPKDVVTRVGERVLVRRASLRAMQALLERVGVRITQRLIGRVISRWIPVIGAAGIAGYAFVDTRKVARTAIDLFSREIEIDDAAGGD